MIKELFKKDKESGKGLLAIEWVVLAYIALTFCIMLFTYTKLENPQAMLWGRFRALIILFALWGIYRAIPCRLTLFARVAVQLMMLALWYPDTYELNRMFTNQDHIFAEWDQMLFGCQPALIFAKTFHWAAISELMDMGYFSYYPMIGVVILYYFIFKYEDFSKAAFVILASFFIYYVIYIFLPVVGPTYYYNAVGLPDIAKGVFPPMENYFNTHSECLVSPGYQDGFFYHLVEDAKASGERPTAAFPSSHVGISTICILLVWHARNKKLLYFLLPFYIFLCLATVYIQAHYLVDAIAGFFSALVLYFSLMFMAGRIKLNG
nr:phosphatase PAP2 family protein [Prevotella sp.]